MQRLEMKNYTMILTKKQVISKISAVPSSKIDKYEYLIGEELLTLDQIKYSRILDTDQILFTGYFSKDFFSEEAMYELNKTK